jgi:Asp-tRNA(Asn)/Glu-tRNA(Gln) amidotransferase B subunit
VRELADCFEAAVESYPDNPGAVAKWLRTEVVHRLRKNRRPGSVVLAAGRLAGLVAMVDRGEISRRAAKEVLAVIWESGEEPQQAVDRLGLRQVRDRRQIAGWIEAVLREHPQEVARYRDGKTRLVGFFVGQVLSRSGGRADPGRVQELVKEALDRSLVGTGAGPAESNEP